MTDNLLTNLELERLRDIIARQNTLMKAAAAEINEHWEEHCDETGAGPCNLVRQLENGMAGGNCYPGHCLSFRAWEAANKKLRDENAMLRADADKLHDLCVRIRQNEQVSQKLFDELATLSPNSPHHFDVFIALEEVSHEPAA